jgi:BlaI family penicillinase repressor
MSHTVTLQYVPLKLGARQEPFVERFDIAFSFKTEPSCALQVTDDTHCNVTHRDITKRPLTDLQQSILDFLWANGPATSEQVRESLLPEHRLKDASIRTLLRRLEQRNFVRHSLEGRIFLYEAAVRPYSVAAGAVRQIIGRFCSGSVEQFLVGMVDERVLTVGELRKLTAKIQKAKAEKRK